MKKNRFIIAISLVTIFTLFLTISNKLNFANIFLKEKMSNNIVELDYKEDLIKYKSSYIGNASNISNLIKNLKFGNLINELMLETYKSPYGITVYYEVAKYNEELLENSMKNAIIIFSLIDNLENIHLLFR